METHDDSDSTESRTEVSPKSKQKKKSLCQLLLHKKTKVGCLERDGSSNKISRADNSQHSSHTSTKLSLCCAMTERSRTPPQSLTASRLSPMTLSRTSVKSEVASNNDNCQVQMEKVKAFDEDLDMAKEAFTKKSFSNEGMHNFVFFINYF